MKGDFTRLTFNPDNHYSGVRMQQGRVQTDADWNEQVDLTNHQLRTTAADIGMTGVVPTAGGDAFAITLLGGLSASPPTDFSIQPGVFYVDGIRVDVKPGTNYSYLKQPYYPNPNPQTLDFSKPMRVYLDVWERHITALEDSSLAEVALGGPDTATRTQLVWQVKVTNSTDPNPPGTNQPRKLRARGNPDQSNLSQFDNRLYRVEVVEGGTAEQVKFVWSRDNGSTVVAWNSGDVSMSGTPTITVGRPRRSDAPSLAQGQWLELTDDAHELNGVRGALVQIAADPQVSQGGDQQFTVSNKNGDSIQCAGKDLHAKARVWDGPTTTNYPLQANKTPADTDWVKLENGIEVQFQIKDTDTAGNSVDCVYNVGDYWLIPARAALGGIDWPQVKVAGQANPDSVFLPPRGVKHHSCWLATITRGPAVQVVDNRPLITPISQRAIHVLDVQAAGSTSGPFAELPNDSDVAIAQNQTDLIIRVLCDASVDGNSTQPATCFLTIEVPHPNPNIRGCQPLILPASVSASASAGQNTIEMHVATEAIKGLWTIFSSNPTIRLLTRLTLKGRFIWGQADPTIFLDGETSGIARQDLDRAHTGLRLPKSGSGRPASDFEMWFWLGRPPAITFSPNPVIAGQGATGTVTLDSPAPTGGVTIKLAASPAVGTVPPSLNIPAGSTTGTFSVTNTSVPVGPAAAALNVIATSDASPGPLAQGSLTINQVNIASLSFNPSSARIVQAATLTGTVTLNALAPVDTVILLDTNRNLLDAPASVRIQAGQNSVSFSARANSPGAITSTSVDVKASLQGAAGWPGSFITTSIPFGGLFIAGLRFSPPKAAGITSDTPVTGTVTLNAPASVDTVVLLTSFDPHLVLPEKVTVPANQQHAAFQATAKPIGSLILWVVGGVARLQGADGGPVGDQVPIIFPITGGQG